MFYLTCKYEKQKKKKSRVVIFTLYHSRRNFFEEEEVDLNEFTTSWLQYLLSKEMKFENLIRLWGKTKILVF